MNQQLDRLKEQFNYDLWRNVNTLGENLFIWQFLLSGNELPGWYSEGIEPIEIEEFPRWTQSIWQPIAGGESRLSLNIYECDSRLAAHEFLLQLLGEFQSPLIERQADLNIGDVAFGASEGLNLLFARANLVVSIANAERVLIPILDLARQLDQFLCDRPQSDGILIQPNIPNPITREMRRPIPVSIDAFVNNEAPRWYKFFASSGEVMREGQQLSYHPTVAVPPDLTLFAIDPIGS